MSNNFADQISDAMGQISEATRLTREGRYAEATDLMQGLLGGAAAEVPAASG